MPSWAHRTTFKVQHSVAEADLLEVPANYVENPDLSAVAGSPTRYSLLSGDTFSLMDPAGMSIADTAVLSANRDGVADAIDRAESYSRAFALIVLDEINVLRLNAGLVERTAGQLKTALRSKLDG